MAANNQRRNSKRFSQQSPYYVDGNVAYKLEPERNVSAHQPKRVPQPKAKHPSPIRFVHVYFVMAVIFLGCVGFMGSGVLVQNIEMQIRQQKNELSELQAQNAILEAELAEQIDLEYIKQEALTRLGMAEPQSYQVVYIDVPKQSYTIQYAVEDPAQHNEDMR